MNNELATKNIEVAKYTFRRYISHTTPINISYNTQMQRNLFRQVQ